ncbi:MAG: hypothetical protein MZV49_21440 [Rhodopseudomonas palustris]|nr:hypothetical protein [Rhodopseudomonas palustris]
MTIDTPVQHAECARGRGRLSREIQLAAGRHRRARPCVVVRDYRPSDPRLFAAIRVNYPRITAVGRSVRTVARRPRPVDQQPRAISRTGRPTITAAPTQRNHRRGGRQPRRPGAAAPVKRRPIPSRRTIAFDKYRKGNSRPRPPISRIRQAPNSATPANDQLRTPDTPTTSSLTLNAGSGRGAYRARSPRIGAGVLRDGRDRLGGASRRRGIAGSARLT